MTTQTRTLVGFVDPATAEPLERSGDELRGRNGARFPIVNGIARFVESEGYAEQFGIEWNIHTKTQLDSHNGGTISRVRLEGILGAQTSSLEGKLVLETGCGAGRFTELMVGAGAIVHSIDLSSAVDANRRNIGDQPNHVLAQSDLLHPPFPPESFDVVVCLGVAQSTPPPTDATLRALWGMVKPGGTLVVDHYAWDLSRVTQLDPLFREVLKRLPPKRAKRITDKLTEIFFPAHWAVRNHRWLQALLSRISPLYTYMHRDKGLDRQTHFDWAQLDAYDHLADRYKRMTTVGQMRRLVARLDPASTWVRRGGNGVEARLVKRP
ncbi:MAG TPA: class I SAM-dependent methyltransferase [Chloroflexota bacterium]|nr:class I SAM-dependent methyltransferase [Chloroflexota bacterium]